MKNIDQNWYDNHHINTDNLDDDNDVGNNVIGDYDVVDREKKQAADPGASTNLMWWECFSCNTVTDTEW